MPNPKVELVGGWRLKPDNLHAENLVSGRICKIEELKKQRIKEKAVFLEALRQPELQALVCNDSDTFASALALAICEYGVMQKDIAAHLGVDQSAVGRWKTAEFAPKPYSRPAVLTAVAAVLEQNIEYGTDGHIGGAEPEVHGSGAERRRRYRK